MSFPPPTGPGESGRAPSPITGPNEDNKPDNVPVRRQIPRSAYGADHHSSSRLQQRTAKPVSPQLQVNPVAQLAQQYQQTGKVAAAESTKVEFLESIPDLKKLLTTPGLKADSFPFDILYFDSSGNPISVLTGLDGHPDAEAIKKSLLSKLDNIEKGNTENKVQHLKANRDTALHNFAIAKQQLSKFQNPLPALDLQQAMIFIDDSIFSTKAVEPTKRHAPHTQRKTEPHFVLSPKHPSLDIDESAPPIPYTPPSISRKPMAPPPIKITPVDLSYRNIKAEQGGSNAPIFPSDREINAGQTQGSVASVNSGTGDLSIGGDGINAAFAKEIARPDEYKELHNQLMGFARRSDNPLVQMGEDQLKGTPLKAMYAFFPRPKGEVYKGDGMGAVFVDVIKDNHPNGCAENQAMVYVSPPKGSHYKDKAAFLSAVSKTAFDIPATVNNYNKHAEKIGNLPKLETLRMCAISSGLYRHDKCSQAEVEAAVRKGIEAYKSQVKDNLIKEIQLPPQLQTKSA
ncbi:hypothetical protein EOPP23_00955 [Endozoicomonas sp. OPT23]|uniref:hypothetical protein n=1 Tax=Endozoicomonas sp. OPT23 TaxID=2072845 RepID=UPI00129A2B93|nr:hypothetical protein [Endozoicomonas sp. OPT23]MRI31560.1 hypothetical protein [Endozoicomonas sp. OPT23]